ncbi:MAG: response regulator transcription factor [Erysipelotrichaceae bacterium]|nr:response regulator transcription factor [Erysipelotrichaceae bacterium]
MKILVIEDDILLANAIKKLLESKNFEVEAVYDGKDGVEYAELGVYDLLILDVMMPSMNGYEVARKVRSKRCTTPILMLTAKSALEDRVEGLNAGADYYLTKPFDAREMLACINALLRRQGKQVNELTFGNTALDLESCMLVCNDKSVRLSAREFDVMRFLLQAQDRILSKEVILSRVWGYDSSAVENHVEVYVGFLRKKLTSIGSNINIEAIRRLGYHLEIAE